MNNRLRHDVGTVLIEPRLDPNAPKEMCHHGCPKTSPCGHCLQHEIEKKDEELQINKARKLISNIECMCGTWIICLRCRWLKDNLEKK